MVKSSKLSISPVERQRLESQLAFIRENKAQVPGLARSVAQATGFSPGNVYAVFNEAVFNATIIREAYAQLGRSIGLLPEDFTPARNRPEDDRGLELLTKLQTLNAKLHNLLGSMRDIQAEIRRTNKDILITQAHTKTHMTFHLEDMTDEIATTIAEYLRENVDDQASSPISYPSYEVDTAPHRNGETKNSGVEDQGTAVSPDVLKAMEILKSSGDLSVDGFLVDPPEQKVLKDTPDSPDRDPMEPGWHVDAEGEKYYIGKD